MVETPTPVELFCSYAHEDEPWLRKLETHLSLLQRQGLISLWHDRLITPGTNWAKVIDTHLETASIILLLVSTDFFASDYCVGIEMKRALERQEEGSAVVIPILVSEVNWREAPLVHLQALPTDARPLAIWPDEERALADVASGIRRAVEELPLLAASAPRAALPAIWNIPYPRNPYFLGRDDDLAHLRSHLQASQATALSQPLAISGLGGIGKTQLALEYAYRAHQDYQAVLWARAESTEALVSSYVAIASLLRLPEREAKKQDLAVQAVKAWLQTHRSWLLILDNADELALLADFLPPALGGHLLLTTRASATGRLAHRLEIETLLTEHATLFLLRRAALLAPDATLDQVSQEERELAVQISQELGRLPLALDQAGAYLEETGMDLAEYWHIYQRHRADLLRERRGLVADHPAPLATTWSLSFQRVEEKNPAAAELLRLCAFLSPDTIPEEILTADASSLGPVLAQVATDAFQLNRAIEALRSYSLMRRDPKGKTLSVHRLVQAVLQDTLEDADRKRWAERAVLAVNATFPDVEQAVWSQCERLLPHALQCVTWIEHEQFETVEAVLLLHDTGYYLQERGRYQEAEPLFQSALRICERALGQEHPWVGRILHEMAVLYQRQRKYAQAEPLFQRALNTCEQTLGKKHLWTASTLHAFASLYQNQGKYAEAEPLYQRSLQIKEQESGPEDPFTASTLHALASLYQNQGKYAEAEPLYQRALQIKEKALGPEHPSTGMTLQALASLYQNRGQYAEAEPLCQRTLLIFEQAFGAENLWTASALQALASVYQNRGKTLEAEPLFQRALRIREQAAESELPPMRTQRNPPAYLRMLKYEPKASAPETSTPTNPNA